MLPVPTPTVPTDNLYKFLAVFGLILAIFGTLIPNFLSLQYVEDNKQRWESFDKAYPQAEAIIKELPDVEPGMVMYRGKRHSRHTATLLEAWSVNSTQETYFDERLEHFNHAIKTSNLMTWGGGLLSVLGFVLWYWKVQRYQDLILKTEWAEKQKSTAPTPSE